MSEFFKLSILSIIAALFAWPFAIIYRPLSLLSLVLLAIDAWIKHNNYHQELCTRYNGRVFHRQSIIGLVRMCFFVLFVALWSVLLFYILFTLLPSSLSLNYFAFLHNWYVTVWFSPYLLLPILSYKNQNYYVIGWIRAFVIHTFYDVPAILLIYIFHLINWRINKSFTFISHNVFLGALPFASDVPSMAKNNIRGVVNMCSEWSGPVVEYSEFGIEQLRLPVLDYDSPTLDQLKEAVSFIEVMRKKNHNVLVHCKQGIGRSATIVMAWLLKIMEIPPKSVNEALEFSLFALQSRRREVARSIIKNPALPLFIDKLQSM